MGKTDLQFFIFKKTSAIIRVALSKDIVLKIQLYFS